MNVIEGNKFNDKFTVYPAIDLRGGQVVRLFQGDPDRQTTYGDDPGGVARRWFNAGAKWLHVVNLDGAFGEAGAENQAALGSIIKASGDYPNVQVQFGGGLRALPDIESALSKGVQRVILGTMAVEDQSLALNLIDRFGPQRVCLGIDARQGRAHIHGWQEKSTWDPVELGKLFYQSGVKTCIFTNINRDGSGRGVDVPATQQFGRRTGLSVIASGGVAALEDVRRVRQAGMSGVIIGRALYEGTIDLKEALSC